MFKLVASFMLFALVFTACGGVEDASLRVEDDVAAVSPGCAISGELLPEITNPEAIVTATGDDGFVFDFKGTEVRLNQNMSYVLAALGEPLGVHETPSCAFDGFDRIFRFPGVQFHTFPIGDEDFVQIISIWDDSVTTRGGIFLGSDWDSVLAAYGADYQQEFSRFTFVRGDTSLSFFVDDYIVREITYSLNM